MHNTFVTAKDKLYNHYEYRKNTLVYLCPAGLTKHPQTREISNRQHIFIQSLSSYGLESTWFQLNLKKGKECMYVCVSVCTCVCAHVHKSVFSLSVFKILAFIHIVLSQKMVCFIHMPLIQHSSYFSWVLKTLRAIYSIWMQTKCPLLQLKII